VLIDVCSTSTSQRAFSCMIHDLQRPNACSFEMNSWSILQCICMFERIVTVTVTTGEICREHKQTHLACTSTYPTTNTSSHMMRERPYHFHEKKKTVDDLYVQWKRGSDGCRM
jgi:hypothetical protein